MMPKTPAIDPAQVRECHVLQKGVDRSMLACRVDPSGRFVVAGGMMPEIIQYELAPTPDGVAWDRPGQVVRIAGHKNWVCALAFAPDGHRLLTGDYSGLLHAWEFPVRDNQQPVWTRQGHRGWVRAAAVSPDGRLLATCGNDHAVRLWATADGQLVRELIGHDCHVYNLAFHPGGLRLASGDLKGQVKDWDVATGKLVRELHAKEMWTAQANLQLGGIRSMTFDPDGRTLACGGMHGIGSIGDGIGAPCVMLFDWETGKRTRILQAREAHRSFVNGVHFHPSGWIIGVTGGLDGGILLFWQGTEEKALHQHKLRKPTQSGWSSDLLPDQVHLAVAHHDRCVRIYDLSPAPAVPESKTATPG
jgi:WD40 repeat protein